MAHTISQENRPQPVVLDRYELRQRIGAGGFATVYRAYDHKMGREVAVKVIRRCEELSDRVAREARAAAKLAHARIVTVFELAEDDRNLYLVSELVEGGTLAQEIAAAALSDRDCLEVALQILDALNHAHSRGVVHRDIKPDNIMLGGANGREVKVMDFGIAQLEDTQQITRQGDVIGTLAYMSPEQADGRPVDKYTDVYSAALTLYECLTGVNPFRSASAAETIGKIQLGAPLLSAVRPDLPLELSHLIAEALESDPGLRLDLPSLARGLKDILPQLAAGADATQVLSRRERTAAQPRSYRWWPLAGRAFNGALAALIAWVAVYGSSYYPLSWRLPLVLALAAAVASLPRIGLLALAAASVLPVLVFSSALGVALAVALSLYYFSFALFAPRVALLPALAAVLAFPGLGLIYPLVSGVAGRLRRGLTLAFVGGVVFTLTQLFAGAAQIDYLGLTNNYDLPARLAGEHNPWSALKVLFSPLIAEPVIALQPGIWLAAALPAALLVGRRNLWLDLTGLILADGLLVAGYLALPLAAASYRPSEALLMKSLIICGIIQIGLLLLSAKIKLRNFSPRERIKKT